MSDPTAATRPGAPPLDPDAARRRATAAGVLATAAALVVTEAVGLLAPTRPSLVLAVETWFLDTFAGSLKDLAVALFGTQDKTALAVGTVLVALLVGAGMGRLERRRPGAGVVGIATFGVLGVLATWRTPQGSVPLALLAAALGVSAGAAVLLLLLDRFGVRPAPWAAGWAGVADPFAPETAGAGLGLVTATRRDVLVWGAGTGAAIVAAGAVGQEVRSTLRASAAALPERLPAAVAAEAVPTDTLALDGLTPYIVPNVDFYRIDTALQTPVVDTGSWTLRVTGLVDRELELSYADLLARDLVEEVVTLSCVSNEVGGDLVGNARWRGIPLRDLLAEAGVAPEAAQVVGESVDGFTAGFPLAALDDPDRAALLAVGMNGAPLPRAHGFPARLVVSGLYGYVSATKWLREVRLTTLDEDGYWIDRGWAKDGPVKTQCRIDVPRRNSDLRAGPVPVAGVAWAPSRGIDRVEVRIDDGPWQEAELGPVTSDDTWVQWVLRWDAPAGDHTIEARATDGTGATQPEERTDVLPDGATGWPRRLVRVD